MKYVMTCRHCAQSQCEHYILHIDRKQVRKSEDLSELNGNEHHAGVDVELLLRVAKASTAMAAFGSVNKACKRHPSQNTAEQKRRHLRHERNLRQWNRSS